MDEAEAQRELDVINAHLGDTVELTLSIAELLDLIECGLLANSSFDWNPPIVAEIQELFSRLCDEILSAADEV